MSTPTDTTTTEDQHPEQDQTLVQGPPVPEPDQHGWVHIGHDHLKTDGPVVTPNCAPPCYQVVKG